MVVNEDRFFLSHRKSVALAARNVGYDVVIVTKNTGHKHEIEHMGFRVIDLPINPTGMNLKEDFKTFWFLICLYRKERPSVVHHVGLKNILWGGLAARFTCINAIVNAVSGLGGLFNGGKITITTRSILAVMAFSNHRHNVKVIFQNYDDINLFCTNKVVRPEQIEFTKGSGINLTEYSYSHEPGEGKIKIIFTARMVREKGICDLIEAAERMKEDYKHKVKFLLCGRLTPNKTGITEKYMHEHCDGEYICWLGERNDVKELLKESHIMAFPSYYREGVPKSLIEACAIGRPIITCNSTGCKDVVDNQINGFLIEPRNVDQLIDALKKMIESKSLREKMGKESRIKAEKEFSIQKVVETHLRIYNELTNKPF